MNIKKSLILLIMCLALPLVGQAQSAHWAITPTYQSVTPFAPGLFKVKTYASVGICDADEKWVVSLAMDSITNIVNGYAFALTKSKDKYRIAYIIRDNGTREAVKEEVYAGEYLFFNEERCPVTNKKGKYGYINPSGALVVDCDYSSALPFINGRALVTKEKGGFAGLLKKSKAKVFEIDLQGKAREVSQIDPSALNPSYTGLMSATYTPNPDPSYQRFSDDKEYGYRKGNRIILPTQFESAGSVSDDCAIVMVNHLFGVVRFNAAEVDCKVSESGGHLKAQATLPGVWENKVASIVREVGGASRKEFEMVGTGLERTLDVTIDKESGRKVYELVCNKLVLWRSVNKGGGGGGNDDDKGGASGGISVSVPASVKANAKNVCSVPIKVVNRGNSARTISIKLSTGQSSSIKLAAGKSGTVTVKVPVTKNTSCKITASGGGASSSCSTSLKAALVL